MKKESREHKELKYHIKGIAEKFGYRAIVEMPSPYYMSFVTGKQKKYIDVWCEYSENINGTIMGRQIPIEIYKSELIENITLDKSKYKFYVRPNNSFRIVVSFEINIPYTIPLEETDKYFDLHIIPSDNLDALIRCLSFGKRFLIMGFEPKINGMFVKIMGIRHYAIKDDKNLWKKIKIGEKLFLKREPNNKYDENAIKVFYKKKHIGYIEKYFAKELSTKIDNGKKFQCLVVEKIGKLGSNPLIESNIIELRGDSNSSQC